MWVNRYLPALRQHPALGLAASGVVVATSLLVKLLLPSLPPFLTLYPAVLLSALLGGKWVGRGALIICIIADAADTFVSSLARPAGYSPGPARAAPDRNYPTA